MAAEGGNFDKFIVELVRYGPGTPIMKGGLDHFYSVIQYDDPSLARSIDDDCKKQTDEQCSAQIVSYMKRDLRKFTDIIGRIDSGGGECRKACG